MSKITILGDVHGKYDQLDKLKLRNKHVVQLGDLGFDYSHIYDNYDSDKFKVCLGNHDNYDERPDTYDLGDFGSYTLNNIPFYYIRGGFSVDKKPRITHEYNTGVKVWWKAEELNRLQMEACIKDYTKMKPSLVLTHTCPTSVAKVIGNPATLKWFGLREDHVSNTQQLLQVLFEAHQPKRWFYGHFHRNHTYVLNGTIFRCVGELKRVDLEK